MRLSQLAYIAVGVATFVATYLFLQDQQAISDVSPNRFENTQHPARDGKSDRLQVIDAFTPKVVRLQKFLLSDYDPALSDRNALSRHFSYLAYYPYSEVPPAEKPAEMALDLLKKFPVGTPLEEIKRASGAFGLDFNFMKAVAKIESDFDPKQRTGSYIGLFQLSKGEFRRYGSGDILNPRDNAIAAAAKFSTAAALFELRTHKKPTIADLYLIHQQGTDGAEEEVSHPDRLAWQSMCATDEGKQKGEGWCKRAIWGNTTPEVKQIWKSVDNLTSSAFVKMWRDRVDRYYVRYSQAMTN